MFAQITLHDFSQPLAARKASRKYVGPYTWRPAKPGTGRGFYMTEGHGGIVLRIEDANDSIPGGNSLRSIDGYYIDSDCHDTLQPIIARLPHGRGYLAGWTMGTGMASSIDAHIWETAEEAAMAAHDEAERAADREQEYRAEQDDDCDE